MRVLFFTIFPEINAGSRYRVHKYLTYLKKENIEYPICPPMSNTLFQYLYQTNNPIKKILYYLITYLIRLKDLMKVPFYDVIFIHQGLCYFGPPIWEYLIAKLNTNVIYDVDDADFSKPAFASGFAARFHDRNRIAKISKLSKQVIVSVDYIGKYVEKFNSNVTVIPTSIDTSRYTSKNYDKKKGSSIIIGWVGSASGLIYLQNLEEVMQKLSKLYDIELRIISSHSIKIPAVKVVHQMWTIENEITDLQSIDIGIMPLPNTEFEKGKGGFKLIQYMGVGVPVVCSPVGVNAEIVTDGTNGYLADTKEAWFEKLSLLIKDENLRERLGRKGRESIQDKFTVEANAAKFVEIILSNSKSQTINEKRESERAGNETRVN
ncbi:glycosyltransferase family 4 protein [candidate division KSB1 bacterium]|nr:glycosyltransferase family 4 protein [candidate division KSB1 bacterium]